MNYIDPEDRIDLDVVREQLAEENPLLVPREDDPLWKFLEVLTSQLDRIETDIDELHELRYVDTATGRELDFLGNNIGVERNPGESDSKFRKRVKAGYLAATSDATFEDVAKVARAVLDASPSAIEIRRPRNVSDPATAQVLVESAVLNDSPFTNSEIADILSDAIIGGHRIEVATTDAFTWDDANLGWGTEWGTTIS